MSYHVSRGRHQLGVFPLEQIREKLAAGELLADDLARTEATAAWRRLGELVPAESLPSATAKNAAVAAKHRGHLRRRSKPGNNLLGALFVTLFCPPLGIPAIVYACQVKGKYQAGDYSGARQSAQKAKTCILVSLGLAFLAIFAYAVAVLIDGVMGG